MTPREQLERGSVALGVQLDGRSRDSLIDFADLLLKWNRVYNLTAAREAHTVVSHHLLDSLAVLPHLKADSLADVGSGGGLPGVPLAIARPAWRIALIEPSRKKAAFLTQAKIELALDNVAVIDRRVEDFRPGKRFGCVISRAFSDLDEFVRAAAHLLAPDGTFAAMKGARPVEEISRLSGGFFVDRIVPLRVPGIEAARHLILIRAART